jgi:hypothetical protein
MFPSNVVGLTAKQLFRALIKLVDASLVIGNNDCSSRGAQKKLGQFPSLAGGSDRSSVPAINSPQQ